MIFEPTSVLVTGGAGFIGSKIAYYLGELGIKVVVLDILDACSSIRNLEGCKIRRFVQGDIRDADAVLDLLETEKIDTVLHFAAHTHVDASFGNSIEFTLHNTFGTHALLEACRVFGKIKRFVNVSTDEVYGESLKQKTESSLVQPTNPYAAAKAGAELMARAYHMSFGLPVITTRGNNVYGPRQYPEKLVGKCFVRAARGLPLEIHGDGSARRSFVYIDDAARAFVTILQKGVVGEIYNIASPIEKTVLEVAQSISYNIRHVRDRAFNDLRYFICDRKLHDLGWVPQVTWEDGLRLTAAWYAAHADAWWPDVDAALDAHC